MDDKNTVTTEDLLNEITKEAIAIGYIEPENTPTAHEDSVDEAAATANDDLTEDLINQAVQDVEHPPNEGPSWRNRLLSLKDRLDETFHTEKHHLPLPQSVSKLKSMAQDAALDKKALSAFLLKLTLGGIMAGLLLGAVIYGLPLLFTPTPPPPKEKVAKAVYHNPIKTPAKDPAKTENKKPGLEESSTTEPEQVSDEGFAEPDIDYTVDSLEKNELVRMLAELQYLPQNPVSVSPERVRDAVYAFQKDNNLAFTGRVNVSTISMIINKTSLLKVKRN